MYNSSQPAEFTSKNQKILSAKHIQRTFSQLKFCTFCHIVINIVIDMVSFYLILIAIKLSLVYGDEKYVSTSQEEFGKDSASLLKADFTCCPSNQNELDCIAEATSSCIWFSNPNDPIAQAGQAQCLSKSYVECKRTLGIDQTCSPTALGAVVNCPPNHE